MASRMAEYLGNSAEYFAVFGALTASYIALKFVYSLITALKTYVLARTLGLSANLSKMGQWAVVTGATDGIGKAYAEELARQGMDIVLISRNPEKLADVAAGIEGKYKVKTKCVSIDFTGDLSIYEKAKKELANMEIGVLVNNVGMGYDYPEFYLEVDDQTVKNMINVNCSSVVQMTRIVMPGMVERRRGAVINISSASGMRPTPMLTLYSATKAFVDFFSAGLQTEYKSKGIIVQSVMPFFVSTKLSKIRRASFMVPTPTSFVCSALATVGVTSRTTGCISHALQALSNKAPDWLYNSITMSQMIATKKRAQKRLQSKKE